MTEKQINRWLRRQFRVIGWVLIGYYVQINLLVTVGMVTDMAKQYLWSFAAGDYAMTLDMDAINGNAWGYITAVAAGLLMLHGWKGRDYWKQELLVRESKMKPGIFACMMVFCMGAQLVNTVWITLLELLLNSFGHSVMPMLESVSGATDTFSMFLYAGFVAPLSEEILFRGFVLRSLRPYGKRFAIFGSALLFGLFHGNLLQTPYAFLVGLVLGYLAAEYSLGWAVGLHMFNNLILAEGLSRLTGYLPVVGGELLHMALFGISAVASAAILLTKRQQIRTYRESDWMDRRCLKCFLTNSGMILLAVLMLGNMLVMLFAY